MLPQKPIILHEEELSWEQPWGPESGFFEKKLLRREHFTPVTCVLRKASARSRLTGYKLHTHPVDEIAYVIGGRAKAYVEGVGETESRQGMLIYIPAGTKHGNLEIYEDLVAIAYFFPPYEKDISLETSANVSVSKQSSQ